MGGPEEIKRGINIEPVKPVSKIRPAGEQPFEALLPEEKQKESGKPEDKLEKPRSKEPGKGENFDEIV
ncbi:MAG: hypothetical protein Q7R90_04480 [bacterium]|nr:hypothetical protein [bacterium]